MQKGIIFGTVILLMVVVLSGLYYFKNNNDSGFKSNCDMISSLDNSQSTIAIIECYLNNKKASFKSGIKDVPVSEVMKGECKVKDIENRYLDNKSNQVTNERCTNCRLDGARIWFECSEYASEGPFGCNFDINKDFVFGELKCPFGV